MKQYEKTHHSQAQEDAYWEARHRRQFQKDMGVCAVCRQPADLEPGETVCSDCRLEARQRRSRRREDGLCTKCGIGLPEDYKWKTCDDCRRRGRADNRRHAKRRGKPDLSRRWRRLYATCPDCRAPKAIYRGKRQDGTGEVKPAGDHLRCNKCGAEWVGYRWYLKQLTKWQGALQNAAG